MRLTSPATLAAIDSGSIPKAELAIYEPDEMKCIDSREIRPGIVPSLVKVRNHRGARSLSTSIVVDRQAFIYAFHDGSYASKEPRAAWTCISQDPEEEESCSKCPEGGEFGQPPPPRMPSCGVSRDRSIDLYPNLPPRISSNSKYNQGIGTARLLAT